MGKIRNCGYCKELIAEYKVKRHPFIKYCSSNCFKEEVNRVNRKEAKLKRLNLRCKVCSEIIPIEIKSRSFCSKKCEKERIRNYSKSNYQKNKSFYKEYYQKNRKKYKNIVGEEYKIRNPEWDICVICKKEVLQERRIARIMTCSKTCSDKNTQILRKYYQESRGRERL